MRRVEMQGVAGDAVVWPGMRAVAGDIIGDMSGDAVVLGIQRHWGTWTWYRKIAARRRLLPCGV